MKKNVGGSTVRKIDAGLFLFPKRSPMHQITSPHKNQDKKRNGALKERKASFGETVFRYKCRKCKTRLERTRNYIRHLSHPSLCGKCANEKVQGKAIPAERIVRLAQSGQFTTQQCIADQVGLSRERVRQVLKREGVEFGQPRIGVPISWPCPECGETITRKYALRNAWRHMPAHCRRCAATYCYKGHKRTPESSYIGTNGIRVCRICRKEKQDEIVRYRQCIDCKKNIPVTFNSDRVAKYKGWPLKRCKSCHGKYWCSHSPQWKGKRKTHCKRGHPFDEKNTLIRKSKGLIFRKCKACTHTRERRYAAAKKKQ